MWIQVFGLCCLISVLTAQKPPTTPNHDPECSVMKTAAKHLSTGIGLVLQKTSNCQVNPHCTGVICTWSDGSLEVDLHHCKKPIKYHVYINAPGYAVKNLTLGKGEEKMLYHGDALTLKLKVTELKRQENIVTTTVEIETCTAIVGCNKAPLLNQQKFCVRMQNCPGYNASAVHYKPCGFMPTGPPPTGRSTTQSPSLGSSSTDRSSTQSSSLGSSSTGHTSGHVQSHPARSTSTDPSGGSFDAHKGHRKDSSLSTGAIIGICAAAIVVILIVVGVVVYWKKYHHRSRLRAAYYNDISMHDPLYEDFGGPEVA